MRLGDVWEAAISISACTEEGESVVPASVGDMKPSSRTRTRDAARMNGIREEIYESIVRDILSK
jgi:hypothetical protein